MFDNKPLKSNNTAISTESTFSETFKAAVKKHEEEQAIHEKIAKELSNQVIDIRTLGTDDKAYADRFIDENGSFSNAPIKYHQGKGWTKFDGIKWVTYKTITDSEDAIKTQVYLSMDKFKFETLVNAKNLYKKLVKYDASMSDINDIVQKITPRPRNKSVVSGILYAARSIPGVSIPDEEWDKIDPDNPATIFTINTPDGLYDLRSGQLYGMDPEFPPESNKPISELLITKCTAVSPSLTYHFNEHGECTWLNFINSIFPDPAVRNYAQKFFGYCLLAKKPKDLFCILYGTGGNGKTLLVNTINHALGFDYVANMSTRAIMSRYSKWGSSGSTKEPPQPSIVKLKGARLAIASELKENDVLDAEAVKSITGGGIITARDIGGKNISFEATHQLTVDSNFWPKMTNPRDSAIWRRVVIIPFIVDFTDPKKAAPELKTKLLQKEVLEDCLLWQLLGAKEVNKSGLPGPLDPDLPQAMKDILVEYRRDVDKVGQWITDCCRIGKEEATGATDLYLSYIEWHKDNVGGEPLKQASFGKQLNERIELDYNGDPVKITKKRGSSGNSYKGIGLIVGR